MTVMETDAIDQVEVVFDKTIILGIKRVSLGDGFVLSFLLMACAIDCLAGFNAGKAADKNDYIKFLNEYKWLTKKYNPKDLYESLRCGLVHNFTTNYGKFCFSKKAPEEHRLMVEYAGRKMINLNFEDFFRDFIRLKQEFFAKVRKSKGNKRPNFLKRFKKVGFIMPAHIEDKNNFLSAL